MRSGRARGLFWPGVLVGIGIAGTLDEVVLHQLLRWHHFHDRSTPSVGLISDGLFHILSTTLLVIGVIQLVERRRTTPDPPRLALAGILLGAGGFNLYDGTIQHKLLGLNQVRAGAPDDLPYVIAFLTIAAVVALAGALLLGHTRHPTAPDLPSPPPRPSVHSAFGQPEWRSGSASDS